MSNIRIKHDKQNPYVVLNKKPLACRELSWSAKGLWSYLLSLPDDWKVSVAHLSSIYQGHGGGRDAIQAILSELIEKKYAIRIEVRQNGKFGSCDYEVYESPNFLKELVPQQEFPAPVSPAPANPALLSTNPPPEVICTKKQQHVEETKVHAAVFLDVKQESEKPKKQVKVYASLRELDMTLEEKIELSKYYKEDVIDRSVAWATHPSTKINTTLIQTIKWACKANPEMPVDAEKKEAENKIAAQKLISNCTIPRHSYVDILNKGVEIGFTASQAACIVIEYGEKEFIETLKRALTRYGVGVQAA